jgi:thiamine-phosphate pyrophosphorylase
VAAQPLFREVKLRGLYAITPEAPDLIARVGRALDGGVALLQYRRKQRDPAEAREIVTLARARGVPVIINDDVGLALEVGADGVHLGRDDGDLAVARQRLPRKMLGASCYDDIGLAEAAVRAGADYVAFGSVFLSPTKPDAVRASLSLFRQARTLGVPLAAIGGITLGNAPRVIEAGADMLAVISDLFDAPDIARRAADYRKLFT